MTRDAFIRNISAIAVMLVIALIVGFFTDDNIENVNCEKSEIIHPEDGMTVGKDIVVRGNICENDNDQHAIWIVIKKDDVYWPVSSISPEDHQFSIDISESGNYSIVLLTISENGNKEIQQWMNDSERDNSWRGLHEVPGGNVLHEIVVKGPDA